MTADELRKITLEALDEKLRELEGRHAGAADPSVFVLLQEDGTIIVLQSGGQHFGIVVLPVTVQVAT